MNPLLLESIAAHYRLAYAITDSELRIVEIGGERTLLGPEEQCWIGKSLPDMAIELIGSEAELDAIVRGDKPLLDIDLINRSNPDGTTTYVRYSELPYRDKRGTIRGILHLVKDVTEQAQHQQHLTQQHNELRLLHEQLDGYILQLKEANAELHRISETKSTFVATAAHELRTPLTSIQGFLEIVLAELDDPLTETQQSYLQRAWQSSDRLQKIVTDLLDVLRIELDNFEITLRPESLHEIMAEVVSVLQPQRNAKSQQLALSIPPNLPPILCDIDRMVQICTNLLSNAIKYSPEGGSIDVWATLAPDQNAILLSIADNGRGISHTDQAALFTRFFRAAEVEEHGPIGFGLGLYITRALVEMHGGTIWVDSELGRGSTFHVTLPVAG